MSLSDGIAWEKEFGYKKTDNNQPTVGEVKYTPFEWKYPVYQLQPHKCPVCNGKTIVPAGFYSNGDSYTSSSASDETCKSCNGKGIIWG